ncbi:MAG: hypothetical protein U9Q03_03400 [Patescibacteria group bacterium]|nr:hypothetical protein [Patescibacteria group bacterium]
MPFAIDCGIIDCRREEFDILFEVLTGFHPTDAEVGEDGFLFIPPETGLGDKPREWRECISELAGPHGWRNNLVNDDYAGWWIRRPAKV